MRFGLSALQIVPSCAAERARRRNGPSGTPDERIRNAGPFAGAMKVQVMQADGQNLNEETVRSFGREWSPGDLTRLASEEKTAPRCNRYLAIFPWNRPLTVRVDIGCPVNHREVSRRIPRDAVVSMTLALLSALIMLVGLAGAASAGSLHYAPNGNFASNGSYLPGKAGFNVADVNKIEQLEALPPGVKGLIWVSQCGGVDAAFLKAVQPFVGKSNVFGFFLMDDPDPRGALSNGGLSHSCTSEHLMAESDWLHANAPGSKTLITLMNLASSKAPSFTNAYSPANSHVDLFGLDAYPCRTEVAGCDYDMIDRYVNAASSIDIPKDQMVPFYQAFGGGAWKDDLGGQYVLPTPDQERQIIERWQTFVKAPLLDAAYSWGSQKTDDSLEGSPVLQDVFARHNLAPH